MAFRAKPFRLCLLSLVFPLLSAILAVGQSNCGINLGSVLTAGAGGTSRAWISPAGEFAFGFQPLVRSPSTNQDLFLLAIWYNQIPKPTIVWSLNDHPVQEGSRIQITDEGQLILYNSQGQQVWMAETGNERIACAGMLDSGNFVLINGASIYIWESFRLPTDTILPGQRLSKDGRLFSRRSDTDYADGKFQLRMQLDGNLVLYPVFLPTQAVAKAYWASGTNRPDADSELVFDEAGLIYIEDRNRNIFNVTERDLGSRQEFYYMARIDYDGALRHYNHPRGNYTADARRHSPAWSVVQTTPEDMCSAVLGELGSGACGYNSYCVSSNGRPNCLCPEGYSHADPLDTSQGCMPNFQLPSCQQNGWELNADFVEFTELNNTNWPFNDYELQTGPQVDKEMCKEFCLRDCFCAAAIYNGKDQCWKKRFPLSNGIQSASVNGIALIKVPRNNETTLCPESKDRSTLVLAISVLLGSSVFFNFLLLIAISVAIFFLYHKKMLNLQPTSTLYGIRRYTYKELEEATGSFKQQLGRGSFGTVYKGVNPSNPMRYIAIKRLDMAVNEGENEFTTEVNAIGQTHHKNLVNLLGYCDEGNNRLLVYEYMSNGSLASLLFSISRPRWNQRLQIAFGIARGLTYLHEECSTQIIHCDVKPQNILLDEYLVPKISDFGLAKLLLSEQSRVARSHIRERSGTLHPSGLGKHRSPQRWTSIALV
ncbi:UNVERIFIED_CONTAM: G-type lectin S-receptor-like serine/threonine-protein kinase LECRK3 [Sesamum radiatum]|uniref:Receptor-like serine/threonine-protein kinase n=1 Tax=Sesamum radiatum TaxID=300843 RepID=A0AAW2UNM8_SESRA